MTPVRPGFDPNALLPERTYARSVVMAMALAAALLAIASLPASGQDSTRDTTARPGIQFDGFKLVPAQLTYQTIVERDSARRWPDRTIAVARSTYNGSPAWLLVEAHPAAGGTFADSLVVDLSTLRPLHWSGQFGYASLGAEFRSDSMFGVESAPSGRRSIVMPLAPGALITTAMIESALRALPLAAGFRDSVSVLATGTGSTATLPGELEVVGGERLTVPAGAFDCWIVTLTTDAGQATYWVAKREGYVVKTSQLLPDNGGLLTYILTRVGR